MYICMYVCVYVHGGDGVALEERAYLLDGVGMGHKLGVWSR